MVPSYPTPEDTANGIIRLGNLHPGFDGGTFLVIFVVGFAAFLAIALLLARRRRAA